MIFAPERMVTMEMLALKEDVELLAGLVAKEGCLHIVDEDLALGKPEEGQKDSEASSRFDRLMRMSNLTDEILRWIDAEPDEVDQPARFLGRRTEELLAEAEQELNELRDAVSRHFDQRDKIEGEILRLDEVSEQMHLLNDHDLSFLDVENFKRFYAKCGALDAQQLNRLESALDEEPCVLSLRPVSGRRVSFLLIGDLERKDKFDGLLADIGAGITVPPERYRRSFEEGLEQVEMELWQKRDGLADLAGTFQSCLPEWRKTLSRWFGALQVHKALNEAMLRLGSDGTVTLISGFVPDSRCKRLVRRLEEEAPGRYFARFEDVKESKTKVPTKLSNWPMFRPFELFVKTYGLPGYNDIDPTPFVAVSFLLMFGMMFGDVGHGLILAAIGAAIAYLPYRIFTKVRDLGRVLVMAGLSGTLFGFLFGSIFGVEEDSVLPALWMRPSHQEHLTAFLFTALCIGIAVITLGIVLNIVQAIRKRNVRTALIGEWSAASLVFFWALLLLCGMQIMGKEIPLPFGGLAVLLTIPLILITGGQVFMMFRAHKKHKDEHSGDEAGEDHEEELATVLFEPLEIVMNLFSNSVSFLRVAAFGLAHAALTTAIFVVNDMVHVPALNFMSLPFEHLFIIVLEGMIVTIQCLRLEYYEFFSKFFIGDGVAYTPLTIRNHESAE